MRAHRQNPHRRRAATWVIPLLAVLSSACTGDGSTPTSPGLVNPNPVPSTPTSALPASDTATPGTYERVEPHSTGLTSRFLLDADGNCWLTYFDANVQAFELVGTLVRVNEVYQFHMEFDDGLPANAWASFSSSCFQVLWINFSGSPNFEDGQYCLANPVPPSSISSLPISETATPGTYERVEPVFDEISGETFSSRFLIEVNGQFQLQYENEIYGLAVYDGTYSLLQDVYLFALDDTNTSYPVQAYASFQGPCLEVRWNATGQFSGYEDGTFCR